MNVNMFAFFMQQLFSVRPIIAGAYLRRSTTLMSLMDSLTTFYQKQKTKQKKTINGSNTWTSHELQGSRKLWSSS